MAFVNEYIPEADYEKYDLRRVCGEHNLKSRRGHMYSRDWTIDREKGAFLIQVWAHHESEFSGWAFFWKGTWIFFEMRPVDSTHDEKTNACWFKLLVKGLVCPANIKALQNQAKRDLRSAITEHPGGVTYKYSERTATIEFIEE